MGKPYASELALLDQSYREASQLALDDDARRTVTSLCKHPLVAVGSGGSLTAAHFAAALHEKSSGQPAEAVTPLMLLNAHALRQQSVLFLSARGNNPDILAALSHAIQSEASSVAVITRIAESPLAKQTAASGGQVIAITAGPTKDGYLATNTLLATLVLLYRLYDGSHLPETLAGLLGRSVVPQPHPRPYLIALHGASGAAAAYDFESRCSEAGLAAVQVVDYRNFAHGRHQWLQKHLETTAIVMFGTAEDRDLVAQTRAVLPSEVPTTFISTAYSGPLGSLALIVRSMQLAGELGTALKIDPGRPHVAPWGRRFYHLRPRASGPELPLTRKVLPGSPQNLAEFRRQALERLQSTPVKGIALDYDGTIVSTHSRFHKVSEAVRVQLRRLSAEDLPIAIATGRGDSAVAALRDVFPKRAWDRVWLGLYGGALIQSLAEDTGKPDAPSGALAQVQAHLEQTGRTWGSFQVRANEHRLSLTPNDTQPLHAYWRRLQELVVSRFPTLQVRISSHSVDVTQATVRKDAVIEAMARATDARPDNIVRVGDQGAWPGNDFELLDHPLGLTVDETSTSLLHCWDFTPRGLRGPAALTFYLEHLRRNEQAWIFDLPGVRPLAKTRVRKSHA